MLRVFIDAVSADVRRRLTAEATRAGWHVVNEWAAADAVLAEPAHDVVDDFGSSTTRASEPPRARRAWTDDDGPREALTPRERDVLVLLAEGAGNREIAARLGVTEHTVKFHLSAIFGKLGAATRTEAVRRALRWGWVDA